jgi:Domain of unknown function (DUF4136)
MFFGRFSICAVVLSVAVAACTSAPKVRTDTDPSANLATYKTFAFFDRVATDNSSYTTILTQHLKAATQRELEKRGFQMVASNPQLLVNFNINIQDKTSVQSSPSMSGGYYGYRAGYYGTWAGYPQDIHTVHYQDGTLSIDLVDATKKQLVWSGIAEGRIKKEGIENPGPAIDRVVTSIFEKYPAPAVGS